jgi:hypothetical protein
VIPSGDLRIGAIVAHGSDGVALGLAVQGSGDPDSMAWIDTVRAGCLFWKGTGSRGVLNSCGQAIKGAWGMSWRQEA